MKRYSLTNAAMSKFKTIFVLWLIASLVWPASAQTNYSKTTEFPALRISVSDLQDILAKVNSLIMAANTSSKIQFLREEIEVRNGDLKIKISGHLLETTGVKIPKTVDVFEYDYSNRDGTAISNLNMRFGDYSRALTVSGNSPDQVDAVFSALRDHIQKLSTPFGGSGHRSFLGFFIFALLAYALIGLIIFYFQSRHKIILVSISLVGLLLVLLFTLPLGDMLAGFVAVSGDASFMVRYGPQMSFWGFVLGAVALPITLVPIFYSKKSKPNATSSKAKIKIEKRVSKGHSRN